MLEFLRLTADLVVPPMGLALFPYSLVLLLVIIALHRARSVLQAYQADRHALAQVQEWLRSWPQAERPSPPEDLDAQLQEQPAGPVRDYFQSLLALRTLASPPFQAAEDALRSAMEARLVFLRPLPNLLLLLGIIGTVIGLAQAVASLGPQIRGFAAALGAADIATELGATLEHMRSAFSCTLIGATFAALSAWLVRDVEIISARVLDQTMRLATNRLIPALYPPTAPAQIDELRQVLRESWAWLRQVRDLMSEWPERMRQQLSEWARALQQVTQEVSAGFQAALETAREQLVGAADNLRQSVETMRDVSQGLQDNLSRAAINIHQAAEGLAQSASRLESYHNQLSAVYADMQDHFVKVRDRLDEHAQEQVRAHQQIAGEFRAAGNSVLQSLAGVSDRLDEATGALVSAHRRLESLELNIGNTLDAKFEDIRRSFNDLLDEHARAEQQWQNIISRVGEELRALMERLDPRLLPRDEWQSFIDRLEKVQQAMQTAASAVSPRAGVPSHPAAVDYQPLVNAMNSLRGAVEDLAARPLPSPGQPADGNLLEEVRSIRLALTEISARLETVRPDQSDRSSFFGRLFRRRR